MDFLLDYEKQYWDTFVSKMENEMAVAGLMGNLKAESGLIPYRKQGDFSADYQVSRDYTNQVDAGTVTENQFIDGSFGYGLAQWTWPARKQGLYDMHKQMGVSIGSFDLSVSYLFYEFSNDYLNVYNNLLACTSVKQASDLILHDFEAPADQSETVEQQRYQLSQEIYDKYSGSTPVKPDPGSSDGHHMPIWMYFRRAV